MISDFPLFNDKNKVSRNPFPALKLTHPCLLYCSTVTHSDRATCERTSPFPNEDTDRPAWTAAGGRQETDIVQFQLK